MGANAHSQIVPLWTEPPRSYTQARPGGPLVEHKGRRRRLTVDAAWNLLHEEEAYENGHMYSGDFGSKGGCVLVATNPKIDRFLEGVDDMVRFLNFGEHDPRQVKREQVHCSDCHGRGQVLTDPSNWQSPLTTCPACKGKGKRGRNPTESAAAQKRAYAARKAVELLGESTLRRAAQIYDDKWGPAAAIAGKDRVWFGGWCPS